MTSAASAAVILGLMATAAHADKISDGIDGWNMDNVTVIVNDGAGTYNEADGTYSADYEYFRSDVDNGAGTVTGEVRGKDWPVGEPPGIKVVNSDSNLPFTNGKPSNCIMTTSYLEGGYLDTASPTPTTCDSGFQTHKRFKVAMLPAALTSGGVDLVFNVEATATPETRHYQVFQKINNYTGTRLDGFTIEIGTGVGANFAPVADTTQLALSIPSDIWADEDLATFSHGLFGPIDSHFPEPGFFDDVRAGFDVQLSDGTTTYAGVARGTTDPATGAPLVQGIRIESTGVMASNYTQAPPTTTDTYQFGEWIHSGQTPYGIFFDDDNDPTTDAELVAFWGTDSSGALTWMRGEADGWAAVDANTVAAWYADAAYSVGAIEDLLNLAPNYIVTVKDSFVDTAFTIRITPSAAVDNTDPAYVGSDPAYTSQDGIVVIGPNPATVGATLYLRVNDGDIPAAGTVNVSVENLTTGESETVTLDADIAGIAQATLSTSGDPADGLDAGGVDQLAGVLYVTVGDTIRVTYQDADDGDATTVDPVAKTAETVVADTAIAVTTGSGGGCTVGTANGKGDWSLPMLLAAMLGFGLLRRRRSAPSLDA